MTANDETHKTLFASEICVHLKHLQLFSYYFAFIWRFKFSNYCPRQGGMVHFRAVVQTIGVG